MDAVVCSLVWLNSILNLDGRDHIRKFKNIKDSKPHNSIASRGHYRGKWGLAYLT